MSSATLLSHDATTAVPAPPPETPLLSAQHLAQLDQARVGRKKINRALLMAGMSAWTLAVFAALSLPFMLFDPSSGLVGIALSFIAYREFAGRHKLKQLQPTAARHLGWNQIALCGLIALYAGWQIAGALAGPSPYAEAIHTTPELAPTLEPIAEFITLVTLAVYGSVLVIGLLMQGAMALYYFTRRRHILSYLDDTPEWIVALQRHG